ncbi:hypothetical protein CFC21_019784 [Triticum aestivum]|uniref:Uncharacterized protein n=4 Tax=Triticum TaxID=4564 RepID=A0A9R1P7I1_TRITD|nr:hypothetical protein CFC21_019784 [Triticum aestivum]VAH38297.1 unnamed protein product [Triticum turgidum subsp. durum]
MRQAPAASGIMETMASSLRYSLHVHVSRTSGLTVTVTPRACGQKMASGSGKATASSWAAAMSVGAGTVEAITERHAGLCRWNHQALPCVFQQRAGTSAAGNGACGKGKAATTAGGATARQEQEEELRTVMYLSNWGPNN